MELACVHTRLNLLQLQHAAQVVAARLAASIMENMSPGQRTRNGVLLRFVLQRQAFLTHSALAKRVTIDAFPQQITSNGLTAAALSK